MNNIRNIIVLLFIILIVNNTQALNTYGNDISITGHINGILPSSIEVHNYSIINVKSFGAFGNGVTDDSDALQAAADSLYPAWGMGNCLYFPHGIYIISRPIIFKQLCIDSDSAQLFTETPNISIFVADTDFGNIYYGHLKGITFSANSSNVNGIEVRGTISGKGFEYNTILENNFLGTYRGIYINRTLNDGEIEFNHNKILNNKFTNYGGFSTNYGVYSNSGSGTGNIIFGNTIVYSKTGIYYGIINLINNIGDIIITNNFFYGCNGCTDIYFDKNASYRSAIVIQDNYFESFSTTIDAQNYRNMYINNNAIPYGSKPKLRNTSAMQGEPWGSSGTMFYKQVKLINGASNYKVFNISICNDRIVNGGFCGASLEVTSEGLIPGYGSSITTTRYNIISTVNGAFVSELDSNKAAVNEYATISHSYHSGNDNIVSINVSVNPGMEGDSYIYSYIRVNGEDFFVEVEV